MEDWEKKGMTNSQRMMAYYKSDLGRKREAEDMKQFKEEYPDGYPRHVQSKEEFNEQVKYSLRRRGIL